jgi:hypothetical protein
MDNIPNSSPIATTRPCACRIAIRIEPGQRNTYTPFYIRPLAVSPLDHSEGVPIPWGFFFSGAMKSIQPFVREGLIP